MLKKQVNITVAPWLPIRCGAVWRGSVLGQWCNIDFGHTEGNKNDVIQFVSQMLNFIETCNVKKRRKKENTLN